MLPTQINLYPFKLTKEEIATADAKRLKQKLYYTEKYAPKLVKKTQAVHLCSKCKCVISKHSSAWYIRGRLGATSNHNPIFGEPNYTCTNCHEAEIKQ